MQHPGVDEELVRAMRELWTSMSPEERFLLVPISDWLQELTPEERMRGLTPEERLQGLTPEERMRGLTVEERLLGLTPEELKSLQHLLGPPIRTATPSQPE